MERLHMNEIRELIYRFRKGESNRAIARTLQMSKNTVKKYRHLAFEHGFLDTAKPLPSLEELGKAMIPPTCPRHMRSTVDPYEEIVREYIRQEMEMQAMLQRLREDHGYTGSYSSVRRFVRRIHPKEPEAVCRIETAPGEEAQVDFGSAGLQWDPQQGKLRKAWVFVMTLSWSRHQYAEFVFDQRISTWLQCHERAFSWFNGVPKRVVIDNLKAGVLQADIHDPVLGEPYRRFAQHYGFCVAPNRPRTPQHKGKVESGIHYVKRNFLAGQRFADLQAMNERVKQWIQTTAGERIHGTTKEAPLGRFHSVEIGALQPLPATPFELLSTHRVTAHRDCHVIVDQRYYSVPHRWIGKKVDVYVGKVVEIYVGTELVTTHPVVKEKGGRSTRIEHYPESKQAWLENPPERCRERAKGIGESCSQLVDSLLNDPVQDRLRSVQSLLRLSENTSKERVEKSCQRALRYGDPTYRRVKSILQAGLDQQPLETEDPKVVSLPSYRFARAASAFFPQEAPSC